jgi:hypothetical protein
MQLAYASEAQDALGRVWQRQRKLAKRLKADDDTDTHPPRPRGMHRRTYERLLEGIWECEAWRDAQLCLYAVQRFGPADLRAELQRIMGRAGR